MILPFKYSNEMDMSKLQILNGSELEIFRLQTKNYLSASRLEKVFLNLRVICNFIFFHP